MDALDWMSLVIGACNPASALLTGPYLARKVSAHRARQFQGAGWAVLAVGQSVFLVFGIVSGLPGFRWVQPLMIVVAVIQFRVWRKTGWKQPSREVKSTV